ncbi:MAG TPA: hypothetical protein VHV83_16410, partial [Armatimonadota bacterium]|nr:hypothetical protein [Armatimonadota bacterium]
DTIDFATATANEDGSYSFKAWNGTVSDITVLSQYTERPPADCRLLFPHKGRMLYIGPNLDTKAYDTLFISNWDDAAHVPQALTVDTPPLFGGWIVIGEDGGEITGLGAWGSYCLIFKRLGIWQLSGETASDFAITPVSVSHGCVAHETVQQIEDGVTVWLDHNHVWAMTTQGIQNIGLPIERLLKAYSVEQQAQAFAVFDKGRGWYHLTLPDGVTFVLYRTDSGEWAWSRWTGQPAACGVYATQWCAPGTYAGDATRPTLCRLNTGCTDEGTPIPFSWTSATLQAPNAQADKAVTDIRIYGSDDLEEYGEAVLTSCTADYHRDSPGAQVTPRAINIDRHASMGRWCLPFSTPTKRYHVTLSGSSSTGGIVAAMAIDYHVRGVK